MFGHSPVGRPMKSKSKAESHHVRYLALSFLVLINLVSPPSGHTKNAPDNSSSIEDTLPADPISFKHTPMSLVLGLSDLNQKQETEIRGIQAKFKRTIKPLKKEYEQVREQLHISENKPLKTERAEIGSAIMAGLVKIEPDNSESKSMEKIYGKAPPDQSSAAGNVSNRDQEIELMRKFRSLKFQIKKEKEKAWNEILAVLTPKQRASLGVTADLRQVAHKRRKGSGKSTGKGTNTHSQTE